MRTFITISDQGDEVDESNGVLVLESKNYSLGAARILAERYRVLDTLGLTTEKLDEGYECGELIRCALAYIVGPQMEDGEATAAPAEWPFHPARFHGGLDRIEDLVRAGQFIAAEIDRLAYIASFARNPQPVMAPEDGGEVVPGRGKVLKRLTGYRPEGDRTLNPDVPETAVVFEPGEGSDPATWFDGALPEAEPPEQISPDKSDN